MALPSDSRSEPENQIADLLGRPVDLIEEGTLKPRVQKNTEAETVRAFE